MQEISTMLRSPERYTPAVLAHVKAKTDCNDEDKIRCVAPLVVAALRNRRRARRRVTRRHAL